MTTVGNLPCAKKILDGSYAMTQHVDTTLAVLNRQLGCMGASIVLGATEGKSPTEQQQADFEAVTSDLWKTLGDQAEAVAKIAADIQATCEPGG